MEHSLTWHQIAGMRGCFRFKMTGSPKTIYYKSAKLLGTLFVCESEFELNKNKEDKGGRERERALGRTNPPLELIHSC